MANILEIILKAKDQTKGAFQSAERGVSGFSTSLGSLSGVIAGLGLATAGYKALQIGRESVVLAQEQARVEAQLAAVIKSTGGAAGVTAEEVKTLASELQGLTNYGDEATISGQNLLLTFTNIGKDIFPDATRTMLDMSAALGQDMKQSAIQLGKALNDPVIGVGALREVGVSFTAEQQNMIKTLAQTGQVAEAQRLILAELSREFGGSAEAARDADGGFQAFSNALGDLQEVFGAFALSVNENFGVIDRAREGVEAWTYIVGEAIPAIMDHNQAMAQAQEQAATNAGATLASAESYAQLRDVLQSGTGDIEQYRDGLIGATGSYDEFTAAMDRLIQINAENNGEFGAAISLLDTSEEAYNASKKAIDNQTTAKRINTEATRLAALAEAELARQTRDAAAAAEQQTRAQDAASARLAGLAGGFRTNPQLVAEKNQLEEIRLAKVAADEEEQKRQEQAAKAMERSFKSAATEIGQSFSSEIGSAVDSLKSVISPGSIPGLDELLGGAGAQDPAENARRIAALATGTNLNDQVWADEFRKQNVGNSLFNGLFAAIEGGDQAAVAAQAQSLLTNNLAKIIADGVVQSTRAEMQQRNLADEINKIVNEQMQTGANVQGLNVVQVAADEASAAAGGVQSSFEETGATVNTFGEDAKASVDDVAKSVLSLNTYLERTTGLFQLATANANSLAEAGARAGVPNGAAAPPPGTDQRAGLGESKQ